MNTRCFAFGCSFTHYPFWPTWADYIGLNHDEYYNCGHTGASNFMMLRRFIEVSCDINFRKQDTILVGLTAFGRYNWLTDYKDNQCWIARGGPSNWIKEDQYLWNQMKFIKNNLWKEKYGIFDTWQMVKTIKKICSLTNASLIVIMALDNNLYRSNYDYLNNLEVDMVEEIYDMTSIDISLQEFSSNYESYFNDSHPSPDSHYDFMKRYFSNFQSKKADLFFQELKQNFDMTNKMNQYFITKDLYKKYLPQRNYYTDNDLFYGSYA